MNTKVFKKMKRSIYRFVLSILLVSFIFVFLVQVKELTSRNKARSAFVSNNDESKLRISKNAEHVPLVDAEEIVPADGAKSNLVDEPNFGESEEQTVVTLLPPGPPQPEKTGWLNGTRDFYDLIIVGAGLSGAVFAEQASRRGFLTSLVIDKRDHIGGNCYDFINEKGIRESRYGAHIFHTENQRVWDYLQQFSNWTTYEHRVKGYVRDLRGELKLVPIPPNQETVNILFGTNITTEQEMENWLQERRPNLTGSEPKNGEEMSLSRVGKDLYEKIFKGYTKKQWDKYPSELDAAVLARLPFRVNNDDRYFSDKFQALPSEGYTKIFENMIGNDNDLIDVRLNVDYFKVKDQLPSHKLLIFTGPIDAYFASKGMEKLEYRSINFEREFVETKGEFFQPAYMVNYPGLEVNYTRIAEYKHTPNQPPGALFPDNNWTIIVREYSTDQGDPYYPVPNQKNNELYKKYQELADNETGVVFVGRLASYKYFNMDQAVLNALELFDRLQFHGKIGYWHNWAKK